MRPQSIAEVAASAAGSGRIEFELADFLHEFAAHRKLEMLTEEPALLANPMHNAYLAAVAAYLAQSINQTPPEWTAGPDRILRRPWFADRSHHMRALLLVESPAAFRARNLFVTANALSVA